MAILRAVSGNRRGESLRGKFMIDTVRGVLRVRKWPKKRGTPTSAEQLYWIDWFRQANKLAKYIDAASMRRAIELTAGTGMYPRDIILKAMRGRLYSWQDQNGKKWYPMAGIQDISDSLDVLAQDIGNVLVRATDRWRAAAEPTPGAVITYQGEGIPSKWAPPSTPAATIAGALVTMAASQTIANTTLVPLIFGAEVYDTNNLHDIAVNPSHLVMPAGYSYARLTANVYLTGGNAGGRQFRMQKNGADFDGAGFQFVDDGAAWDPIINIVSSPVPIAAADYFEVLVYQTSGANMTANAGNNTSFSAQLFT
jgi:hypothetical protein